MDKEIEARFKRIVVAILIAILMRIVGSRCYNDREQDLFKIADKFNEDLQTND